MEDWEEESFVSIGKRNVWDQNNIYGWINQKG